MHRRLLAFRRLLAGKRAASLAGLLVVVALLATAITTVVGVGATPSQKGPRVSKDSHHDVSPPLSSIQGTPTPAGPPHQADAPVRMPALKNGAHNKLAAPVQTSIGTLAAPSTSVNIAGVGAGFTGPQGTFSVSAAPPDTNGAVGLHDYVQTVNTDFAIFNKDSSRGTVGTVRYGPVQINTLWSGFGGLCQTDNDGDPTVVYDQIADRWVISQFAVTGANGGSTPYLQCVAVSQTGDPTGSYYRYSFSYSNFPDYPKMGLWPDGYYETYNLFNSSNAFVGAEACAFDRGAMLTGAAATQQCFTTSSSFGGLLPSNQDGATQPPSGSPNYVVALNTTTSLAFWKFHVDWTTPANTTFTGPANIAVASYAEACGGGTCIPQSGTTQQLDSLADRVMYRLAYRNFGDHEALVVDHAVTAGSSAGMRWYEIRSPNGTPTVFQQATYAPDSSYRWMGSIAMDQAGDMAMGFSVSSSSLHPGIHYTGRLATDALNSMPQGEASIIDGAGSQTGSSLSRWGDYSSMTVDPADDCTFWYTNEYIPSNGAFNWKTQIGAFKFAGCGGTPPPNDFSISASPTSLTLNQNANGTSTISTATTSGSAQTVNLTVSGAPSGASASLSPASVTSGGSSTLTVNAGTAAAGTYTLTVTGTGTSATHTTTVGLTVNPSGGGGGITNGGFETGNLSGWTSAGATSVTSGNAHTGTYAAQVGSTAPTNGDSSIAQTFTAPSTGGTLSFYYNVHCPDTLTYDWATATLRDNTGGTTATVLAKTCVNPSSGWLQVSSALTASHSYTLTLVSHDDNYSTDPTYTQYDDVTIGAAVANAITNGGFETGTLSGWTATGASNSVVSGQGHTGTYAARAGSTAPTNGDSSIAQTFTAPSGASSVTFWYKVVCPDTLTYDWATATLRDNTGGTTATVLAKTCTNNGAWVQKSAAITAGHSYTLTLVSHDDNYTGDATYTYYDDVATS